MEILRQSCTSRMAKNIWRDYPLLLVSHGKWIERHILYDASDNRYDILKLPALSNKKVLGSSHGWLILVGYRDERCCLFNPITMDIIELPDLKDMSWYNQCILTKPPTEPNCHILFNSGSDISFCQIGDSEFVRLSYPHQEEEYRCLVGMGYFQGQIYGFMIPGDQFVTIHFLENTLEFRPIKLMVDDEDGSHPWLLPPSLYICDIWFVESHSDGAVELLMIYKTYLTRDVNDGLDFRVFRINTDQNTCIEIVDIGDRTIFLSHNGCGYCYTSIEGVFKSNSIYYTNGRMSRDRNLHVFDLKDKSTTSRLPSRAVGCRSFTSWVHITN